MRKKPFSIFVVTILLLAMLLGAAQFGSDTASAEDGVWTTMASMPTARYAPTVAVFNGKIYVIGGHDGINELSTVELFDPSTNTWSVLPDAPMATPTAAAVVNNKIYVIGGSDRKTVMEYDPLANNWTPRASMPTERGPYVAVLDLMIYAVGGYNNITGSLNTNEMYNPSLDAWTSKTSMPTPRNTAPIAAANGKIFAFGGEYWPNSPLSTVEEYTPSTDTWATKTSMPTARRAPAAAAVNNSIYVVGGSNTITLSTVEMYDAITDTWTSKPNMPTARYAPAVAVVNSKIYVIGGLNGTVLSTVEMYGPYATPTTSTTVPSAPQGIIATPGDGEILLTWNPPPSDGNSSIIGYYIHRGTSSGSLWNYTTVGSITNWTDTSVTNNQTYIYTVSAYNAIGPGPESSEVNATPTAGTIIDTDGDLIPNNIDTDDDSGTNETSNSTGATDFFDLLEDLCLIGPVILILIILILVVFALIKRKRRISEDEALIHKTIEKVIERKEPIKVSKPVKQVKQNYPPPPPPTFIPETMAPKLPQIPLPASAVSIEALLENTVRLVVPQFIDLGESAEIIVELNNTSSKTLTDISLNFSQLEEDFEVSGTVAVKTLSPGKALEQRIKVKPRYEKGTFPVKITITGSGVTIEKHYTIKVGGTEVY